MPLNESVSVAHYARLAHTEIDALLEQGATPIVVGGSGLYQIDGLSELRWRRVDSAFGEGFSYRKLSAARRS